MKREDLEKMIKIARVMKAGKSGDPTRCNASVRIGGGPNSRRSSLTKCRRPVSAVDCRDQGWCAAHSTEDRVVVCHVCLSTAKQGCCCGDLTEHGLMEEWLRATGR